MRKLISTLACVALALTGCNDWSNEDIEFLYALPSRDELKAQLPDSAGTTQQGLGSRKDGLSVGAESALYEKTQGAADFFNGFTFAILDLVERVKGTRPSKRETNRRIWGPYDDHERTGRVVRLVIERHLADDGSVAFNWRIQSNVKNGPEADWFTVVEGVYAPTPSDDVRRGVGTISFDAEELRRRGLQGRDDDPNLRSLEIRYATDQDPLQVGLHFVFKQGTIDYTYEENADQSGRMTFQVRVNLWRPDPFDTDEETLQIATRWLSNGAGRADVSVTGGDLGATVVDGGEECWSSNFRTVAFIEQAGFDLDENGVKGESGGDSALCAISRSP